MKQDANSNTALFLMELIVVIGFFSLVSVICVRLFVAASVASTHSVNVNQSVRTEESLAEVWISCDGDLQKTAACFPNAAVAAENSAPADGTLTLYFDEDWQAVPDKGTGAYQVLLQSRMTDAASVYGGSVSGNAVTAAITVSSLQDDAIVCSLDVDHYIGGAK